MAYPACHQRSPSELEPPRYAYAPMPLPAGYEPAHLNGQYPHRCDEVVTSSSNATHQSPAWLDSSTLYDQQCISSTQSSVLATSYPSETPIYAPVPLPSYPLLLSYPNHDYPQSASSQSDSQFLPHGVNYDYGTLGACEPADASFSPYANPPPPQTFPTPSELLKEITKKESAQASTDPGLGRKPESSRKARQRAVAKSIGFEPTDPDSISSHEKKRHYLECLEHYVMYLHEQLGLVGAEPVQLERVSNHRGLSSRSIRTLLVHMENTARKLNAKTIAEEQTFVTLREKVLKQEATMMARVSDHRQTSMTSQLSVSNSDGTLAGQYTTQSSRAP